MSLATQVLTSLVIGVFVGLFFGELVAPLGVIGDAFVRSAPDQMEGHVPVAYVVPNGEFDRVDTVRALRDRLAANHIPARFVVLPSIPRTGSGKVDRRALDALVNSLENTP